MIKIISAVFVCAIAFSLSGCDIGSAPSGGSDTQVKAAFDKLPIEERAKTIMGSPAPMEHKKQMIEQMYAKEGKKVPDNMFGGNAAGH